MLAIPCCLLGTKCQQFGTRGSHPQKDAAFGCQKHEGIVPYLEQDGSNKQANAQADAVLLFLDDESTVSSV